MISAVNIGFMAGAQPNIECRGVSVMWQFVLQRSVAFFLNGGNWTCAENKPTLL
jgi:hypothetical protein